MRCDQFRGSTAESMQSGRSDGFSRLSLRCRTTGRTSLRSGPRFGSEPSALEMLPERIPYIVASCKPHSLAAKKPWRCARRRTFTGGSPGTDIRGYLSRRAEHVGVSPIRMLSNKRTIIEIHLLCTRSSESLCESAYLGLRGVSGPKVLSNVPLCSPFPPNFSTIHANE